MTTMFSLVVLCQNLFGTSASLVVLSDGVTSGGILEICRDIQFTMMGARGGQNSHLAAGTWDSTSAMGGAVV